MLAMKMRSHPNRDKEHKRIKDMADISALLLFGTMKRDDGWLTGLLSTRDVARFREALVPEDIERAAQVIGIERNLIENAIIQALK
jgi:ABC-type arginine transport system ATPase subunit